MRLLMRFLMRFSAERRRGSYIAEAAVVLPFVILAILTTVLIILYFYDSSVSESRMHMALRCEAGQVSGKSTAYSEEDSRLSSEDLWDGQLTSSGVFPAARVRGSKSISMVSAGLLTRLGRRQLSDQLRVTDPARSLRLRQMIHADRADPGSTDANP